MSYYGGTITVAGRDLITSLLVGETIEFTRIVVGSGKLPEGIEPIDVNALIAPVADAAATTPVIDNGVLKMTVEYRNDMNGGLQQGFWLSEFGIFAKTARTEEILLYYATLGDSPQPVNAFQDNRIDIRRYPVSIALELEADVQISYDPGCFVTPGEAKAIMDDSLRQHNQDQGSHPYILKLLQDVINYAGGSAGGIKKVIDFTIKPEDWVEAEGGNAEYPLYFNLQDEEVTADTSPMVILSEDSLKTAMLCGMCATAVSYDGYVQLKCVKKPESEISATCNLMGKGASGSGGGTAPYILPVATATTLGGVKVKMNSGLLIDAEGNLSIDSASEEETSKAIDEIFG